MGYKSTLNQLIDFKNSLRPIQSDFIKHLVTVCVILIPLISFLPVNRLSDKVEWFHSLLVALATCILSGTAALYIVLSQHRKMADDLKKEVQRMLDENDPIQKLIISRYNNILKIAEIVCLSAFLISVLIIVWLAW